MSPITRIFLLLLSLCLVGVVGCKGNKGAACTYRSDCADLEACVDGTCEAVECFDSTDCAEGKFCTQGRTCKAGCGSDLDCVAGETCNDNNECAVYACRDTELDCAYGQYCQSSGECVDSKKPHCDTCDATINVDCGDNDTACVVWDAPKTCNGSDSDCPSGYACDLFPDFQYYCHQDRCLVTCDPDDADPCPRGFACIDGILEGDPNAYCVGDCDYMSDNGYL